MSHVTSSSRNSREWCGVSTARIKRKILNQRDTSSETNHKCTVPKVDGFIGERKGDTLNDEEYEL
jgi:hypothetical protein